MQWSLLSSESEGKPDGKHVYGTQEGVANLWALDVIVQVISECVDQVYCVVTSVLVKVSWKQYYMVGMK